MKTQLNDTSTSSVTVGRHCDADRDDDQFDLDWNVNMTAFCKNVTPTFVYQVFSYILWLWKENRTKKKTKSGQPPNVVRRVKLFWPEAWEGRRKGGGKGNLFNLCKESWLKMLEGIHRGECQKDEKTIWCLCRGVVCLRGWPQKGDAWHFRMRWSATNGCDVSGQSMTAKQLWNTHHLRWFLLSPCQ